MTQNREKLMIALKKAKTSLDKVFKMVGEGRYCIDVIQQNLAVIGLLRSANMELLAGHINTCVKAAAKKGGKELDEKMVELIKVLKIAQTK
jgi:CsoR family transcriptional regulator, copper-sensing transcriptional repressor